MISLVGQESVWNECINQFDTPSHIFITGSAGCGKTTLIKEFLQEYAKRKNRPNAHLWGYETVDECLLLGPDQDRGIQTIRGQVSLFIRQMAIGEDIFRWVVIDDVDTFPQISQQARLQMIAYRLCKKCKSIELQHLTNIGHKQFDEPVVACGSANSS